MWGELLPIAALICNRSEELGLSAVELVRRCGYKNISEGSAASGATLPGRLCEKHRPHSRSAFCIGSDGGGGQAGRGADTAESPRS